MIKIAQNRKLLLVANKVSKAIELESEEILEHAEMVIKNYVPARYVKATLNKMEKELEKEGIEALFDKAITRQALRKTASMQVTAAELSEVVKAVVSAVIGELEDVLKDADDVADEVIDKFEKDDKFEAEAKLKGTLEKKLASKGIYARLERSKKRSRMIEKK